MAVRGLDPSTRKARTMFEEVSELCWVEGDGGLPTAAAVGSAPGESGVFVFGARFQDGMHMNATPRRHHICFQLSPQARFDCRIAGQAVSHSPGAGALAICPAGADYWAEAEGSIDAILVAIDPGQFALAAAEGAALEAAVARALDGFRSDAGRSRAPLGARMRRRLPRRAVLLERDCERFRRWLAHSSCFQIRKPGTRQAGCGHARPAQGLYRCPS